MRKDLAQVAFDLNDWFHFSSEKPTSSTILKQFGLGNIGYCC